MLQISDLHSFYGRIHVLKGVSVKIPEKGMVTILGANGAGKSTLLKTISGVMFPKKGSILFQGERIDSLPPENIVKKGISQVPERRELFWEMSVVENLEMGAYARKDRDGIKHDLETIYQLFPVLRERFKQRADSLSGGEQQMLAIGRALMSRPKLMMLDEPSLGLAPIIVQAIFNTNCSNQPRRHYHFTY